MRNLAAALVAALLFAVPAWAQTKQPMYQSGRMVHGDLAKSVTQGVVETVGDLNGDALGIGANPFSVYDRKGLGICFRTGAASAAHNVLCFGHDANENGLITLDSVNGLGDKTLYCRINGVLQACFGGGGGGGTGTVTSVGLSSPGGIFAITGTNPITTSGTFGYTTTGVSGGVPYFSSASVVSASAELTADNPVIGGGTGAAPTVGTRSGNTTQFATSTGSKTADNCAKWDASGNVVDAGTTCGGGGGSGTVTSVGLSSPGGIFSITGTNPITSSGTFGYATAGTSGGVPYFSSASVISSSSALTANSPVIGGGAGSAPTVGTRSGNTTQFVTSTGSKTTDNCVKWDASGNAIDAGITCAGGSTLEDLTATNTTLTFSGPYNGSTPETVGLNLANNNAWLKGQAVTPVALTSGTTVSVDASLSNDFTLTAAHTFTLANPSNLLAGQTLNFWITQDATGGRVMTLGSQYQMAGGTSSAVLSTAAGAKDLLTCVSDTTSSMTCAFLKGIAH